LSSSGRAYQFHDVTYWMEATGRIFTPPVAIATHMVPRGQVVYLDMLDSAAVVKESSTSNIHAVTQDRAGDA
jgi:hypothetical protein